MAEHAHYGFLRALMWVKSVVRRALLRSATRLVDIHQATSRMVDFSEGRLGSGPAGIDPSQPNRRRDALSAFGKPTKVPAWPLWAHSGSSLCSHQDVAFGVKAGLRRLPKRRLLRAR